MKQLSNVRKADKAHGDDLTLSRWVKVPGETKKLRKHQPRLPSMEAAFVREARTKFPTRVLQPETLSNLLVSGHSNVKIGRDVRKGHLKGYWLYTLSLQERATCPSSCAHWQTCYGNNMPFAKRVDHRSPEFLPTLEREIAELVATRGRRGILIRLHALGDFFSVQYVHFWGAMLEQHPTLSIFGYTARMPDMPIGRAVDTLVDMYGRRAMIRFSDGGFGRMSTVSIGDESSCPDNAFVCPEQTGKTRCCATCGACWSTDRNVGFLSH